VSQRDGWRKRGSGKICCQRCFKTDRPLTLVTVGSGETLMLCEPCRDRLRPGRLIGIRRNSIPRRDG
jgi:hypothetical protein